MTIKAFIDAGILQGLIESGSYESFKAKAAAEGYELTTTDQIIAELGRGKPSSAVKLWIANQRNEIKVEIDPNGIRDVKDAGEEGVLDLIKSERQAGVTTTEFWSQDSRAADSGLFDDVTVRGFGSRPNAPGGPVEGAIDVVYHSSSDATEYAKIRDAMAKTTASPNNNAGTDPTKVNASKPSYEVYANDSQLGITDYVRYSGDGFEYIKAPLNAPPEGNNWVRRDAARDQAPDMADLYDRARAKYDQAIGDIKGEPASYDGNGNYLPGATDGMVSAKTALGLAGLGLAILDAWETGKRVGQLLRSGDVAGAERESAGLLGRLLGGFEGAELGAAFGLPGAIIGAIAGAIVGDVALRQELEWARRWAHPGAGGDNAPRGGSFDIRQLLRNLRCSLNKSLRSPQ